MLKIFKNIEGVKVFMSEKKDGNMKLFSADFDINRGKYLKKNNLDYEKLISAKLEHGGNIKIIKNSREKFIDYTDGLLTDNSEIILSVTSADCLPIFLFDPINKVVGILHCGWRSVAKGIIENALEKMINDFKSKPENILVGIGPGIQKCHFEVRDDLTKNFSNCKRFIANRNNKEYFDLTGLSKEKFILNKIKLDNIEIDNRCSYCEDNLWSYRRDGEDKREIRSGIAGIAINN